MIMNDKKVRIKGKIKLPQLILIIGLLLLSILMLAPFAWIISRGYAKGLILKRSNHRKAAGLFCGQASGFFLAARA